MCINAIKSNDQNIKCIGYQHTPVTDNHHAIFKILNGNFNPDKIWCSHVSSYKMLKRKIIIKKKNYIDFIGNLHQLNLSKAKIKGKNTFLVIPEGIYSECKNLFKFCLEVANNFKDTHFIWRVHPVIDFKRVLKMLGQNEDKIPKNIKISSSQFLSDSKKCDFVIYKGSAAVLKAVLAGNYPIYFKSSTEKNFDPLKDIFHGKNYFSNQKEFFNLLSVIRKKNYKKKIKNKVFKIKKDYFATPNLNKIFLYLK